MQPHKIVVRLIRLTIFCLILASANVVFGQATSFTYQGRLQDAGVNANGPYDFEFALYGALSAGSQIGSTVSKNTILVSNGIFNVTLDFGNEFPGANRFLEIRVRPTGGGAFTTLSPRQQINSTPYSIKSLSAENAVTATNATQLDGVAANQYVLTGDTRLSDARNPLPGSSSYIQNTSAPQASSNFNISGNGTVGGSLTGNVVNAATQFNINGSRVLSLPGGNLMLGSGLGQFLTSGTNNTFLGNAAGNLNNSGMFNTFVGDSAGAATQTGQANSFFGIQAGFNNTAGSNNSAFGAGANMGSTNLSNATAIGARALVTASNSLVLGSITNVNNATSNTNVGIGTTAPTERLHVVGNALIAGNLTINSGQFSAPTLRTPSFNTFVGNSAGFVNTTGDRNVFVGQSAGEDNTSGSNNSFVGRFAGNGNTTGSNNTFLGFAAVPSGPNLTNATAIGALAQVNQNNSMVLGSINGINGATSNTSVGIGTTTPNSRLHVVDTTNVTTAYFQNLGTGDAVRGQSPTTTGSLGGSGSGVFGVGNTGVEGATFGPGTPTASIAVFGRAESATGNTYGIWGESKSSSGIGVFGWAKSTAGTTIGVWGQTDSSAGTGVRGVATSNSGSAIGVVGISSSPGGSGVFGFNNSGVTAVGVRGESDDGVGVRGNSINGTGLLGRSENGAGVSGVGVSSNSIGVYGTSTTGRAGYFEGRVHISLLGLGGQDVFLGGGNLTGSELKLANSGTAHFSIYNSGNSSLTFANTSSNLSANTPGSPLMSITSAGNVGIGWTGPGFRLHVNGETRTNTLSIDSYVANNGGPSLCANTSNNRIALCTSSLRYKTNVQSFNDGLNLISRLRPIRFTWAEGGVEDIGLGAEDVDKLEPLLAFRNREGQVEGVKYDHISVVLINAVKEQQAQINQQKEELKQQRALIAQQDVIINSLRRLVCRKNAIAAICRP